KLQSTESAIFRKIGDARNSPAGLTANTANFNPLLDSARSFLNKGDAPIEREVAAMQAMAARARTIVIWQLLALVPIAILLAFGFSLLINRPIRQIDEAIRVMGQGELSQGIIVEGPEDLTRLGERLDWMRRRLLDLEAQKTRFLQHVSHELKTPLTSIREGADLLAAGVTGTLNEKQMQVARILLGNSVELQKRIEDLLNYSAIQSGSVATAKQRADMKQILDAVLQDQHLSIMNKSLQVELNCPNLPLECDEQKIRIAVDNLLSNAVKFSPNGGKIEILARKTEDAILMDIIDSGSGVDPDDRDRIFDAFYQGRKPAHGSTAGTGLGLSIAREYVKAQGGALELMDRKTGGAHFRITLPGTCGAAS
ncbi:MAG: sensor histidine kinase, partial [Burkholderiales bacterium]